MSDGCDGCDEERDDIGRTRCRNVDRRSSDAGGTPRRTCDIDPCSQGKQGHEDKGGNDEEEDEGSESFMWCLFARVREEVDGGTRSRDDGVDDGKKRTERVSPRGCASSFEANDTDGLDAWHYCPFCTSFGVDVRDGNYVCADCNTVVTRLIDSSAEWRCFASSDGARATNPTRCAPPANALLPMTGASVSSSCYGGGKAGGRSGGSQNDGAAQSARKYSIGRALQRLSMWNSMTHRERNLYNIFDAMTTNACNNGISPCILEEAKALYKRIADSKLSRGDNRKALIACSIYTACKLNAVPRSVREIAIMFDVDTAAMTRACKQFQSVLRTNVISSRPDDFISRFCSKLELGHDVVALCQHVTRVVEEMCVVTENTPPALAASIISFCCEHLGVDVPRKYVASVCQISAPTVAKSHKRLNDYRNVLLPPDLVFRCANGENKMLLQQLRNDDVNIQFPGKRHFSPFCG